MKSLTVSDLTNYSVVVDDDVIALVFVIQYFLKSCCAYFLEEGRFVNRVRLDLN